MNMQHDAAVIGSGPAGMTAALYLCRFGLKVALIEKLTAGGQMLNTPEIENYPGFPEGVAGWQLADSFSRQLDACSPTRMTGEVLSVRPQDGALRIALDTGEISAATVVVCSGSSPRRLGLANEDRLIGRGVSFCAMCDGMFYRNRTVAMVGGGNSALVEALYLAKLVKKLYLVHRRESFRADRVYRDRLEQHRDVIEPVLGCRVTALHGDDALDGVTVQSVGDGSTRRLDVAGLFVFIGQEPQTAFLPAELERDASGFIVTDADMRTSIPGIFAAGDIRSKTCRQIVTAVGDAATAAHSAFAYLEQQGF